MGRKSIFWMAGVIVVGLLILFVSMAKSSLLIVGQDSIDEEAKKWVEFEVEGDYGEITQKKYGLPATGMLPSSPFYGFKRLRNLLWIQFSRKPEAKSKIILLVADKKMAESRALHQGNRCKLALKTAGEAVEKLVETELVISNQLSDEAIEIKRRAFEAGLAYEVLIESMEGAFNLDTSKHGELVNKISIWNEKQKEKRQEEGY